MLTINLVPWKGPMERLLDDQIDFLVPPFSSTKLIGGSGQC